MENRVNHGVFLMLLVKSDWIKINVNILKYYKAGAVCSTIEIVFHDDVIKMCNNPAF